MQLLAVPNVSEGRDETVLAALRAGFSEGGARVLDVHTDPDHNRSVFTIAAEPHELVDALVSGAREAVQRIDMRDHVGVHPCVGALDVAPVVYRTPEQRGAACAAALVLAHRLEAELGVPVYLYGALAGGTTRAELRRPGALDRLHPTAGATLVAARPPLIAFNVELAPPATLEDARAIATRIREGGADGLPGVRALGLRLEGSDLIQVSTNIEDPARTTAGDVVNAVARHAKVAGAELVGLAPAAALADVEVPLRGRQTLEDHLDS